MVRVLKVLFRSSFCSQNCMPWPLVHKFWVHTSLFAGVAETLRAASSAVRMTIVEWVVSMVFSVTLTVVVRFANVRNPVPASSVTDSANLDLKQMPTTAISVSIIMFADPGLHRRGSAEKLFKHYLKKNLEDISPFCGATDTLVLDFWWNLLWVSKPEWAALFVLGRGIHDICSLRFTSGVTPADLLPASMTASRFPT